MLRRSGGVLCSNLRKGVRNKRPQDLVINLGEFLDVEATAVERVLAEPLEQGLVGGTHVVTTVPDLRGEKHVSGMSPSRPVS